MTGTQRIIETIVDRLLAREDEIVTAIQARDVAQLAEYGVVEAVPDAAEAMRSSARGNLREAFAALRRDRRPPEALPREAEQEVRSAVQVGLPLGALVQTYRIGHAVAWEAMVEEVERFDLAPAQRRELLQLLSRFAFAYIDAVVPQIEREYAAELARRERRPTARELEIVRELLAGSAIDADALAYDLQAEHVAAIATGTGVEAALRALATTLDRRLLHIPISETTAWAWLGGRRPFTPGDLREMRALALADGACIGFGAAGQGVAGFRASHYQARRAHRICARLGHGVTVFADVAAEALALSSETDAREFVERALAPLSQANGEKLRETLEAYFDSDLNAASAGARLGVSDRTVAYRLRRTEELLGAPLSQRRLELELALRLERLLGAPEPGIVAA